MRACNCSNVRCNSFLQDLLSSTARSSREGGGEDERARLVVRERMSSSAQTGRTLRAGAACTELTGATYMELAIMTCVACPELIVG